MASGPSNGLRPVARRSLSDQVTDRLREFIDVNQLQPGDKLMTERELAEQLGVGRSSIREALMVLRAQGVVDVRHGDGIYLQQRPEEVVSSLAVELIAAHIDHPFIWETRQAIEVQCARLAALRATEEQLAEMRAGLQLMAEEIAAGRPGLDGDRRFHLGVARASGNPILVELINDIRRAFDRSSETSLTRPGQPQCSLADHQQIYDAVAARDADRAAASMLEHLVSTTHDLIETEQPPRP
ncbi:FadR family transcriptional regulator [Nocardioides mangrovicus]|uniref:FadR family transcriptional regulator n=1 Tax=Nocardioides mangrovicus TaxID=2478913 RepID=A0A3L8NXF4_9ACTN|nr:FadR/GntR family transcriptional regulator [Nocardioides mangrovicus]RLV47830.1 FadR family transcriptional regulator [Nocardioides mangrovicus]